MVRVLTITNWYPPHHFGGYELSCHDVMTRLEQRGHETHVLCGDTNVGDDRVAPDADHESRVRRTLRLYHTGSALIRPSWFGRWRIERHNQRELRRAIQEIRPDVVSIWHLAGASFALLDTIVRSGLPVVFAICDDWLGYGIRLDPWAEPFNRSPRRRLLGRLLATVLRTPCVVPDIGEVGPFLFVTRATEAHALERGRWHPAVRAVVWSGIDRGVFDGPAAPSHDWGWRIITTGRFDPRKGFETVVRALALLPGEATVWCWGRGGDEERARLASIAASLGLGDRVHFGTLDRDELPDEYRRADVMVFPSEWAEPFGLVPIEAMACGTPVLATGVGGSSEFLEHERNCLLFTPGDPAALAEGIRRIAADRALRARIVAGGFETAELMDVERLADVMEAWHVYEAHGRQGPRPADRPDPRIWTDTTAR